VLFNSYVFLFGFLPLVLLTFAWLTRDGGAARGALLLLLVASVIFYGWWNWRYVFLLSASILFNYGWAHLLSRTVGRDRRARHALLTLGVAFNLGLLGYYKYANFFVSTVNAVSGTGWQLPAPILPLAISFFTFHQIAFLIDVGRGQLAVPSPLHYGLFVSFFPQLIAGPIVRGGEVLPQLARARTFQLSRHNLTEGLFIFAIGLFKKVVLADTLGPYADRVFEQDPTVGFGEGWGAALAFGVQLYFDFSGYCDMAIGLGRMFNITLPENFESPYKADSIIDFWRRWHITLSRFLRDYLYIPLGGNRHGELRSGVAVMLTMVLGGLWHGAGWTFVAWGGLHGVYLLVNRLWQRLQMPLPRFLAWPLTFIAVIVALVIFRAATFERATVMLSGMFGLDGFTTTETYTSLGWHQWKRILPCLAIVLFCPNRREVMATQWRNDHAYAIAFAGLVGLSILRLAQPSPFIYFQF